MQCPVSRINNVALKANDTLTKNSTDKHITLKDHSEFIEEEAFNFMTNISCHGAINISLMFAFHCNKKSNE